MVNKKKIGTLLTSALVIAGIVMALPVTAKMFIETHIASGTITDIKDNIIELDEKIKYYPANETIGVALDEGAEVTIRYVNSPDEKKKYLELAPGLNALSPKRTPSGKEEQKSYK